MDENMIQSKNITKMYKLIHNNFLEFIFILKKVQKLL